jgi:hypothetical protein
MLYHEVAYPGRALILLIASTSLPPPGSVFYPPATSNITPPSPHRFFTTPRHPVLAPRQVNIARTRCFNRRVVHAIPRRGTKNYAHIMVKKSRLKDRGPDMRTPTFASSFLGQFSDPLFVALQVQNLGPCGASHASIYVLRFGFFCG